MAKIEILAHGHAYLAGARGEAGGAPSKDSIWGVAKIGRDLITYSGRREGVLKFKAEGPARTNTPVMQAVFKDKVAGLGCSVAYADQTLVVSDDKDFKNTVMAQYKEALAAGKVTERKMKFQLAE